MSLVNELQISAEQDDVLTDLCKTKRLVSKLGRRDIADWLRTEQDGYDSVVNFPEYRVISAVVAYNTNGYVPAGYGYLRNGIVDLPSMGTFRMRLREPISDILSIIEGLKIGKSPGAYTRMDNENEKSIREYNQIYRIDSGQIGFLMHLDRAQIMAIPEQIKDKVLDWACDLEAVGVTGDGFSFSSKEKELAHAITFNIHDSSIEQLNNLGTNQKGPS